MDQQPSHKIPTPTEEELDSIVSAVSDHVRKPVDEFLGLLTGIQDLIPKGVKNGLQKFLLGIQQEVQDLIEQKLRVFFGEYAEAIAQQKKKLRLKIFVYTATSFLLVIVGIIAVAWKVVPSWQEIQKERDVLRTLKTSEWKTPEEYYDSATGKMYVGIESGSEITKKDSNGKTQTYAVVSSQ